MLLEAQLPGLGPSSEEEHVNAGVLLLAKRQDVTVTTRVPRSLSSQPDEACKAEGPELTLVRALGQACGQRSASRLCGGKMPLQLIPQSFSKHLRVCSEPGLCSQAHWGEPVAGGSCLLLAACWGRALRPPGPHVLPLCWLVSLPVRLGSMASPQAVARFLVSDRVNASCPSGGGACFQLEAQCM